MKKYEKDFEAKRDAMDKMLTRTYDLGQIHALDTLIRAVDSGTWQEMSYENVVSLRDKLMQVMEDDN
nr:MAG TPA: hypothetical protein [Caudoviricetes sp.]